MGSFDMIKEAPLRYIVTFYVEADSREALEAAIAHVSKYMTDGVVGYVCGPYACVCRAKIEWDGARLTVSSCLKRTAHVVAKLLVKAYGWFGGKAIQIVKCEEYRS
jgi:hypothetical protein